MTHVASKIVGDWIEKPAFTNSETLKPPAEDAGVGPAGTGAADNRTQDFATREQSLQTRAAAAGAQRSDNDADLLGYAPRVKRTGAVRKTLGGV